MVLHVTCVDSAMLTTRFWPFFLWRISLFSNEAAERKMHRIFPLHFFF